MEYTPTRPESVRLLEHARELAIGVLDRGPGIPEAQREAVFLPFHRLEASRSPETGGVGLGLAIVKQVADANGWRVELGERDGGGLAAWLRIPQAADSASDRTQPTA